MMMHLGVEQFEKPGIAFEIDIPEGEGGAHHKMAAGEGPDENNSFGTFCRYSVF